MKWKEHIEYYLLKNSLSIVVYIFYKLQNKLSAFVHPYILYGIEMPTCSTCLKPLNVLNNKVLRILQNCRLKTPIAHLYWEYQSLPINQLSYKY